MESFSPQDIYDHMNRNNVPEVKQGISDQTKEYLRQQLEQVTKQLEAEQREAKRKAALELKRSRAAKVKQNEQEKETT